MSIRYVIKSKTGYLSTNNRFSKDIEKAILFDKATAEEVVLSKFGETMSKVDVSITELE